MYNNLDWLITKVKAITKETTKLSNKFTQYQKKLTAGENITIENNVISASGGSDEYVPLYMGVEYAGNYLVVGEDGKVTTSAGKTV